MERSRHDNEIYRATQQMNMLAIATKQTVNIMLGSAKIEAFLYKRSSLGSSNLFMEYKVMFYFHHIEVHCVHFIDFYRQHHMLVCGKTVLPFSSKILEINSTKFVF